MERKWNNKKLFKKLSQLTEYSIRRASYIAFLCSGSCCLDENNTKSGIEASESLGSIEIAVERLWPISWLGHTHTAAILNPLPHKVVFSISVCHVSPAAAKRSGLECLHQTPLRGMNAWRGGKQTMRHACMQHMSVEIHRYKLNHLICLSHWNKIITELNSDVICKILFLVSQPLPPP